MTPIIGIDLGTTHSLASVFRDGRPRLIPNPHGEVLTPSIVGSLPDERILVGASAHELRVTRPDACVAAFKRWMGTDRTIELGGQVLDAIQLASLLLRQLKEDAETFLGQAAEEAVISVPAYFNEHQRQATKLAGELAGWRVRRIVNEPTAAALAYGFHDQSSEKNLLVFDLGGGTFDVTVMEVFEGTLEIRSTAGESFLGGEDFTDRLVAWALTQVDETLEIAEMRTPLRVARLRQECERAKRGFDGASPLKIRLPSESGQLEESSPRLELRTADFEKLCAPLLERLARPVDRALRDARLEASAIDEVILVGGATRLPLVRELVASRFERPPLVRFDPDEVVALGAAIQGALIQDAREVSDIVLTDVCPFTLGIEVVKQFGGQIHDGYYLPVIHRNTTIPVSREEIVSTVQDQQTELRVRVFQGEARRVDDNLYLGDLEVRELPPRQAGLPVHIRFTYDINGLLEVEAYVPETDRKYQVLLANHAPGLSGAALERAVRQLGRLKFYPRDDLKNRRLILFGERVVGELSPYERERLEAVLDQFEEALSKRERELCQAARRELLIVLSHLGHPFEELLDDDVA